MSDDKTITQNVIGAVESAVIDITEAGISGGIVGAETAAVSEIAKGAGEVAEILVEKFESKTPLDTYVQNVIASGVNQGVIKKGSSVNAFSTGLLIPELIQENHGIKMMDNPPDSVFELIIQWAKDRNLLGSSNPEMQTLKLVSEIGELADAILKKDNPNIIDGIGDAVVCLTILASQHGFQIQTCIEAAYDEIKDRKGVMYNGAFIKSDDARYDAIVKEIAGAKNGG